MAPLCPFVPYRILLSVGYHAPQRHDGRREKALRSDIQERLLWVPSVSSVIAVGVMAEEWMAGEW